MDEWKAQQLEMIDGYVDLDVGIVDVHIGGVAGSREGSMYLTHRGLNRAD